MGTKKIPDFWGSRAKNFGDILSQVQGQPMKYSALMDKLELPRKTGKSKVVQLNELQNYCDLEKLDNPTRYVVNEVYDEKLIAQINGHNEFQAIFECAIWQALAENKGQPLYVSATELLLMLSEINENFIYITKEENAPFLNPDSYYMINMAQIVYKLLKRWTIRRIDIMDNRGIVIKRRGFRLYQREGNYIHKHNVMENSQEEQFCQEIYYETARKCFGSNWKGGWMPTTAWRKFEKELSEQVYQETYGKYNMLRRIYILSPPTEEYIKAQLAKLYKNAPELEKINSEACRKILATTQLDIYSLNQRKQFISYGIKPNPEQKFFDSVLQ